MRSIEWCYLHATLIDLYIIRTHFLHFV